MFVMPEDVTSDYIVDGSSPTKEVQEPSERQSLRMLPPYRLRGSKAALVVIPAGVEPAFPT